jgi:polysaccharide export outer membrane protein
MSQISRLFLFSLLCLGFSLETGCQSVKNCLFPPIPPAEQPTEKEKIYLPPHVINPPDELQIDAIRLVPKPPYLLAALDQVAIQFPALPENLKKEDLEDLKQAGRAFSGQFTIEPEGTVNLGAAYGRVKVTDMTVDEARKKIEERIKKITKEKLVEDGQVFMELGQIRTMQQIAGPHLVRPDGTISLGMYGTVFVAGLTLDDAKTKIEDHLSRYLERPEVAVDVAGFNSKVYYIVFDGAGQGDQVFRMPVYGNETVLDALGSVNGLPPTAWKRKIWVARPTLDGKDDEQILPVDWNAIVQKGDPKTNYRILPGDRIFVQANKFITWNNYVSMATAPIERLMGASLFGTFAYRSFFFLSQPFFSRSGSGAGFGGFGGFGAP